MNPATDPLPDGAPLISVQGLTKAYGSVTAVDHLDLSVEAGDFLAITGPSGSGKSTLLGILGLLEEPSAGEYRFAGRPVMSLSDQEASRLRNRHFGFVFQQFHLLPHLSAWENVARPLTFAGVKRRERKERALAMLERVSLSHRSHHRPTQLSGGEQQRVAIARALVTDPDLILADEPTGNLPQAQWGPILDLLAELNEAGKTVLIVSHEPAVVRRARASIELGDGKLLRLPAN